MKNRVNDYEVMELYQALILDHNKNPRNFGKLENPTFKQEGYNPVCGDHFHVYGQIDDEKGVIQKIAFEGAGCAISKASASMMTTTLQGKTVAEALKIFEEFHQLLTRKLNPEENPHSLGKLQVFSSIWKYPARVKCAGLAWHTLKAALEGQKDIVKTE